MIRPPLSQSGRRLADPLDIRRFVLFLLEALTAATAFSLGLTIAIGAEVERGLVLAVVVGGSAAFATMAFLANDRGRGPRLALVSAALLLGWALTEMVVLDLYGLLQVAGVGVGLLETGLVLSLHPFSSTTATGSEAR